MKTCFKCERTLPRDAFYAHPRMADGLLGKCRDCTKRDVKENRALKPAAFRLYERERGRTPERRQSQTEASRRARRRYPEKYRARGAVNSAKRSGRLKPQPCRSCGTRLKVQAHHHDYSKPLDVEWLCVPCHKAEHRLAEGA